MKFTAVLAFASGVTALPGAQSLTSRQDLTAVTDQYLFSISLPDFSAKRAAQDPATLIWTSDGCTSSPDNPLGFPFVPACNRHDFGYHNYRAQSRFTESGKLRIDDNFRADLLYQCRSSSSQTVCNGLAEVYYAAVRAFGGDDATPGRRDDALIAEYEFRVTEYNKLVQEAGLDGQITA